MSDQSWERDLIEKISTQALTEQRKERRWKYTFRFLLLAYLVGIAVMSLYRAGSEAKQWAQPHIALVDVYGTIKRGEVDVDSVVPQLSRALENSAVKAVFLTIDSPGGSPVQSGLIFDEIRNLKQQYPQTPILAVVGDIAASGGYYIAAAADEIIANGSSIVGSIGVISGGFGYTGAMEKLGIERRLITSGENKALLDPFSPENPEEVAQFEQLIAGVHEQFINAVKVGRGDRLTREDVFTGSVWNGVQGVELGLVDSIGSVQSLSRERFDDMEALYYDPPKTLAEQISSELGVALSAPLKAVFNWSWF